MNSWSISRRDEAKIRRHEKRCVYCHFKMKTHPKARGTPGNKATWEHINNSDLIPKHLINIVLCCVVLWYTGRGRKPSGSGVCPATWHQPHLASEAGRRNGQSNVSFSSVSPADRKHPRP
jgi:hypothetical protein